MPDKCHCRAEVQDVLPIGGGGEEGEERGEGKKVWSDGDGVKAGLGG